MAYATLKFDACILSLLVVMRGYVFPRLNQRVLVQVELVANLYKITPHEFHTFGPERLRV